MDVLKTITKRIIKNEVEGYSYEIAPDEEGIGLVEILYKEDGVVIERESFDPETAKLVADAMIKCANELKEGR